MEAPRPEVPVTRPSSASPARPPNPATPRPHALRDEAMQASDSHQYALYACPAMSEATDGLSPFDALLWERAASGHHLPGLRDAVIQAFSGDREDQLTVWTIIG